ncbi:MAG: hypothetical protein AABW58_01295 [Nanoarchaeota archaeon]
MKNLEDSFGKTSEDEMDVWDLEDELIELRDLRKTDFIPLYGWLHYLSRTGSMWNEPETDVSEIEDHNVSILSIYNLAVALLF